MELNYDHLVSKARQIAERRIQLETRRDELVKQQNDLEKSLVSKFGANHLEQFVKAKAEIEAWEKLANAS